MNIERTNTVATLAPVGVVSPTIGIAEKVTPFSQVNIGGLPAYNVENTPTFSNTDFIASSRLNKVDAVLEAESILAEAARPQEGGIEVPTGIRSSLADLNLDPAIESTSSFESVLAQAQLSVLLAQVGSINRATIIERSVVEPARLVSTDSSLVVQPQVQLTNETRVSYQAVPQTQVEQEVEQILEEQVQVKDSLEVEVQTNQDKKVEQVRLSHAQDEPVSRIRKQAFVQAALRVETGLKNSGQEGPIEGRKIVEFISSPTATIYRGGELNQIDPEGDIPDGGWVKNLEFVRASTFTSVEQLRQQLPEIIAKAPPVIEGEGKEVTDENIATSFKYIPDKIHPANEVVSRVIKMQKRVKVVKKNHQPVQTVQIEEKVIQTNERTIGDLGLAEVF